MTHRYSHNLEPRVSGHQRNRIFRPSKCLRVTNESKMPLFRGFHDPCCQNVEEWLTWSKVPRLEDLTTRKKSLFQAAKMTKRCSTKALYSPTKSFMNLEESHFQAPTERTEALSMLDTYRSRCHAAWVIAFSGRQNAMKVFTRNQVPMCSGSQLDRMAFSGHQNFQYGPTVVK